MDCFKNQGFENEGFSEEFMVFERAVFAKEGKIQFYSAKQLSYVAQES